MARIRTVKPDFWTDEKIVECSMEARLFFIGSWNFADDNGNLQRSAKKLKMQVFPADSVDCEPLIQELITHGLLIEYSVSGTTYLHISGFKKHQLINRPSKSQIPEYNPSLQRQNTAEPSKFNDYSLNDMANSSPNLMSNQTPINEHSVNTHGVLTEHSLTEGKGKDKEKDKEEFLSSVVVPPENIAREEKLPTPPHLPENLEKSVQKPTRKGLLSRQLRQIGIEAAPHHVAWQDLLAYTDEEITAVAEIATQRKPNERIALNYLLRMLHDSGSRARASPNAQNEPFDPLHYALYGDWGDTPQQAPENQNEVIIDVDDSSNTTD